MTPRELQLYADVYNDKQKFEQEEKLTLIYLAEHLHRTENPPSLNEFIGKEEKRKQMTDAEMLAKVMQLNASMGGSVEKVGEKE